MGTTQTVEQILDEEIRLLVDLKRMAADSRLLDLMRRVVAAADAVDANSVDRNPSREEKEAPELRHLNNVPSGYVGSNVSNGSSGSKHSNPSNGGMGETAIAVMRGRTDEFSAVDIVNEMKRNGFHFEAKDPRIAVWSVIQRLKAKGQLNVASQGGGKHPGTYAWVREPDGQQVLS